MTKKQTAEQLVVVTILRKLANEIKKGHVKLLDYESTNGTGTRPSRDGFSTEKYPTGEQWLKLHILRRENVKK